MILKLEFSTNRVLDFLWCAILLLVIAAPLTATAQSGPHGHAGGLSITFAKGASNHRPVNPTREFKETDRQVVLTFRNTSAQHKFSNLDIIAENVEGYDRNQKIMSGHLQTPGGKWNSIVINAPNEGFAIGRYRLDLNGSHGAVFDVVSRFETAEVIGDEYDLGRPNIVLRALGGSVRTSSSWPETEWRDDHLIDGRVYTSPLNDSEVCENCGWAANDTDGRPRITLGFRNDQTATVSDIIIDTRRFVPPNTYFDQISDNFPKLVRISASVTDHTQGFEEIGTFRMKREFSRHRIPFDVPVEARFLQFDILETYGDEAVVMEIAVYEPVDTVRSIVEGVDANIALPAFGGALVTYSGYEEFSAARLFDDDRGTSWQSADDYFPQDFTLAFNEDRIAEIDRVEIVLSKRPGSQSWPAEVAIAISQENPLDGFQEIGRYSVSRNEEQHSFPVGKKARFLKIRVLDNHGAEHTTMSEIRVFETRGLTPTSVVFSGTPEDTEIRGPFDQSSQESNEVEPNDTLSQAMMLEIGSDLVGAIDPLNEFDVFEIPDLGPDANALALRYNGLPNIRHRIELLGASGQVISAFDPGDLPARNADLTFRLQGNEKYLRLSEPPASVVVIWDTSGSMKGSEADLERAVRDYVRRAPDNQAIQLIRFSDEVQVLPGGFSTDKRQLANRLNGRFGPDGGTSLYDAVARGLKLLENRSGNKAILVMTDGEHNGKMWHNELWRQLEQERVRLYTIGLGSGLRRYSPAFASTGDRILRHFALATNGNSFFAADSSSLQKFYSGIASDLSAPASYMLHPSVERGRGQVQVRSIGEQIPSAAMPDLNLVFDISGSMREPTSSGQPRIDVGRSSWQSTSETIPNGVPFELILYGSELRERDGKEIACTDIKTVFEGDFDQAEIGKLLDRQQPLYGATPLAGSIETAVRSAKPGTIIVIITDGKDECAEDPQARMEALYLEGVDDLNINIIGFDVGDPDVESSIRGMASAIQAEFFLANNAADLATFLKEAFSAPYRMVDSSGDIVLEGKIGVGPIVAPTGTYSLEIDTGTKLHRVDGVRVSDDLTTNVTINKVGSEMDIAISEPRPFDLLHECGMEAASLPWSVRDVQNSLIGLVDKGVLPTEAHPGGADNSEGPKTRTAMAAAAKHLDLKWDSENGSRLALVQNLHCLAVAEGKFRPIPQAQSVSFDGSKP